MKKSMALISIILVLLVSACGKSGSSEDTIKIGALYPLTGDLALLGQESFRGVEIAVEEFNENGGLDGKMIDLVKGDAVDADTAQAEANRLINQERIETLVGSYSSGISFAASEVAERNQALFWELGAVSDTITDREYKSLLRINPPASYFSIAHINFIKEAIVPELGISLEDIKVAIVHEDSSYGTVIADEAKKLADIEGINIVSAQPYSSTSNDLSSVVLNIKKVEPDVLIAVSYINDAILLERQMQELGVSVPVFIGSGGGHTMEDFKEAIGDRANGIFNVDFPQYSINRDYTPGMDEFLKLYEEKYNGSPASGHSVTNYMGMKIVLDVLTETGDTNPEKLREAALKQKVEKGTTATGWGVDFDEKTGQNKLSEPYVHQWIDGELVTVWPEHISLEKPQINK